jgi:hypothetical protein
LCPSNLFQLRAEALCEYDAAHLHAKNDEEACSGSLSHSILIRYRFCFLSWFLLGFGSASFHATQTLWGEIFDEVAMVVAIAATCLALSDIHPLTAGRRGILFYSGFLFFVCSSSLAYVYLQYHAFFSISFLITATVVILLLSTLPVLANRGPNKVYIRDSTISSEETNPDWRSSLFALPLRTTLRLAVALSLIAYGLWHFDQACVHSRWETPSDSIYELYWWHWCHPLWHLLTAAGLFFVLSSVIQARIQTVQSGLKRRPGTGSFITSTKSVREALLVSLGVPITHKSL